MLGLLEGLDQAREQAHPQEPEPIITHNYSTEARTFVTNDPLPTLDSIEDQMNYTYETRIGDIDGDGLQDIFVTRTSGGEPNNGALENFFLVQSATNDFSTMVGTPTQGNTAQSWAIAALEVVVMDINIDDFADIFVNNIASVISGADDQLVFAPGQIFNANPSGVLSFGADTRNLFDELISWHFDDDYFVNNAEEEEYSDWELEQTCWFEIWGQSWEWVCEY